MPFPPPKAPLAVASRGSDQITGRDSQGDQCLRSPRSRAEWSFFKRKLDLDYRDAFRLRLSMDEDTRELVAQLATRLGMTFEDAAPMALTLGSLNDDQGATVIGELDALLASAKALFGAILALTNRS